MYMWVNPDPFSDLGHLILCNISLSHYTEILGFHYTSYPCILTKDLVSLSRESPHLYHKCDYQI